MHRFLTFNFNNILYKRINTKFTCRVYVNAPYIIFPPEVCFSLLALATQDFGNDKTKCKLITKNNGAYRPYNFKLEKHSTAVYPNLLTNELEQWCKKNLMWNTCNEILYCGHDYNNTSRLNVPTKYDPIDEFNRICSDDTHIYRKMCGIHYIATHSDKCEPEHDGIIMIGDYYASE